jgi:hypothetical protein
LRLTLAAEHLGRPSLAETADCVDPKGMFDAFARCAAELDAWHKGGCVGPRPAGRLRRLEAPSMGPVSRALALAPYLLLHDPDGRPRQLRGTGRF